MPHPSDAADSGPVRGGHLHLDVSVGCAGDMLCAALLDLGVDEDVLRDGLARAGLTGIGPRSRHGVRGGLAGLTLQFVDASGRPVDAPVAGSAELSASLGPLVRRRSRPTPHRDTRKKDAAQVGVAEVGVDDEDEDRVLRLPREGGGGDGGGAGIDAPRPGEQVRAWLGGAPATGRELEAFLARSGLLPVPAALARRALRRAVRSLAQARGQPPADVPLEGPAAVDLLCDVVGACSLVAALEPSLITASPVAVSDAPVQAGTEGPVQPGPSSWVLHALDGVRVRSVDLPYECTTPTGASLVWALAHRFGPFEEGVITDIGVGLGTRDPVGIANVARVLYGPAPPLATREGAAGRDRMCWVEAALPPLSQRAALLGDLRRAGAAGLVTRAGLDADGNEVSVLSGNVVEAHLDEVGRALIGAGADFVRWTLGAHLAPERVVLEVPLGPPGRTKAGPPRSVRVVESRLDGRLIRAEPMWEDLAEQSATSGERPDAIRSEALDAWRRLAAARPDETDDDD